MGELIQGLVTRSLFNFLYCCYTVRALSEEARVATLSLFKVETVLVGSCYSLRQQSPAHFRLGRAQNTPSLKCLTIRTPSYIPLALHFMYTSIYTPTHIQSMLHGFTIFNYIAILYRIVIRTSTRHTTASIK